jgi:hypothetical protein
VGGRHAPLGLTREEVLDEVKRLLAARRELWDLAKTRPMRDREVMVGVEEIDLALDAAWDRIRRLDAVWASDLLYRQRLANNGQSTGS